MRKSVPLAVILCMGIFTSLAFAWNGTGHMTVAYIAYKNLDNQTRARVDTLLRLNPVYPTWVKGIAPVNRGLVAFLNAGYAA